MVGMTTDAKFKTDVLESNEPVVVDFMADWCMPCRQLAPVIDEVAQKLEGHVKFFKMNIDENPMIAGGLGIRSIPCLALYKNGKVVSTQGAMSKQKMLDWLQDV